MVFKSSGSLAILMGWIGVAEITSQLNKEAPVVEELPEKQ